jgi:hypothetical protein
MLCQLATYIASQQRAFLQGHGNLAILPDADVSAVEASVRSVNTDHNNSHVEWYHNIWLTWYPSAMTASQQPDYCEFMLFNNTESTHPGCDVLAALPD